MFLCSPAFVRSCVALRLHRLGKRELVYVFLVHLYIEPRHAKTCL